MRKKLLLSLGLMLGVFCVGMALSGPVSAEDEDEKPAVWLQVSPVSKRLSLRAGTVHEDEFTVENIGSEEFTFTVYASPYGVVDENYSLNFTNETKYTQIVRWIKFEQTEYTLAPGSSEVVKFSVEVPEQDLVPSGGQYATIFAESAGKETAMESSGVKTISRIGLVVYANMGGETREEAELLDYSVPGFYFSGAISATSKIANHGNTDFSASYHIDIRPLIGGVIYEKDETFSILPDTERRVNAVWDKTPMFGLFKVNYSVTAPNINRNETRFVLIVPVFVIVIVLLLLTFIVVWTIIVVKRRKNLRSRLQIK